MPPPYMASRWRHGRDTLGIDLRILEVFFMTDMNVYKAISAVQGELAKIGIAKDRQADGVGASYKFRGIDDVYAALSPLLAENGLVIIPRVLSRELTERQTKNGGVLHYVALRVEFDLVSAEDGSTHTAATFGEAMDSSDKATNKAMSAAYKYMAFLTFGIPTDGDNDADAQDHKLAPSRLEQAIAAGHPQKGTDAHPDWPRGPHKGISAMKAYARTLWRDMAAASDQDSLDILLSENGDTFAQMRRAWREGWDGDGGDIEGFQKMIERKRRELEADTLAGDGLPLAGDGKTPLVAANGATIADA